MSVIPASGEIDVRDAPKITPVEFVMQIIENIKAQISTIDAELMVAAQSSSEVRSTTSMKQKLVEAVFNHLLFCRLSDSRPLQLYS